MSAPELELPDDADAKRETLRTLAAYRRQVLGEAAAMVLSRSSMWPDGMVSGSAVAAELRRMADG